MLVHVSEALRKVESTGLENIGWVSRDAWFGIGSSCVELKKTMDVNITFIVNNSTIFLPIILLDRFLKSRYRDRTDGCWTEITAVTSNIKIMKIACAWI